MALTMHYGYCLTEINHFVNFSGQNTLSGLYYTQKKYISQIQLLYHGIVHISATLYIVHIVKIYTVKNWTHDVIGAMLVLRTHEYCITNEKFKDIKMKSCC